jgi:hypothetical protein
MGSGHPIAASAVFTVTPVVAAGIGRPGLAHNAGG